MRMNIRAGTSRLWVVGSVVFVVTVAIVSFSGIRDDFHQLAVEAEWEQYVVLPTFCSLARGSSGVDYKSDSDNLCWYKAQDFRRLYPEYKDLNDEVLAEKLYAKVGKPLHPPRPWQRVFKTAGFAVAVPVAVLLLGWSLLWALEGFRRSPVNEARLS